MKIVKKDGWTDGRTDRRMDVKVEEWIDRQMEGWMDIEEKWIDGDCKKNGWMER